RLSGVTIGPGKPRYRHEPTEAQVPAPLLIQGQPRDSCPTGARSIPPGPGGARATPGRLHWGPARAKEFVAGKNVRIFILPGTPAGYDGSATAKRLPAAAGRPPCGPILIKAVPIRVIPSAPGAAMKLSLRSEEAGICRIQTEGEIRLSEQPRDPRQV